MTNIKIDDLIDEKSVIEEISDKESETVFGGKTEVVSCNTDGTYTYSDGTRTWNAKPWWKWW